MIKNLSHELCVPPARDERSRQEFVASLRHYVLDDMAESMQRRYVQEAGPSFQKSVGRPPADGDEVLQAMQDNAYFQFYSAIRYNAQEMVFRSVIPVVERNLEALSTKAAELRGRADEAVLRLQPELQIPRNVSHIDVHLSPGSYHTEYMPDDVSPGALYDNSINVFAFNQMGRDIDDIGHTFANYVRLAHPDFRPQTILDAGCSVGHNTVPWGLTLPEATITGIDVSAGLLRYAAARAHSLGALNVRFQQMNATHLEYPDCSFDLVFSSMFLHELPLKDIRTFLKEAYRVLKPGGLLLTMELPPNNKLNPYDSFYLDWDCYYNKEPYYKPFRDQDYVQLCADAGFDPGQFLETVLPRYTYTTEADFIAALGRGAHFDSSTGRLSEDIRWYGFGAWKQGNN